MLIDEKSNTKQEKKSMYKSFDECICGETHNPFCTWDDELPSPKTKVGTKTVQTEANAVYEQGWFLWLTQNQKDKAIEGERVRFGCEFHCHLYNKSGQIIGWRVYK
jgi:hypothetical protein